MSLKLAPLQPNHHFDAPRRKRIGVKRWETVPWPLEELEAYRRDTLKLPNWEVSFWDRMKFDIEQGSAPKKVHEKAVAKALKSMSEEEKVMLLEMLQL